MTTEQKPLGSGFGAQTTGGEALGGLDLRGKVALVTGGHSGIGLETTRVLSKAAPAVVVGARDVERARANLAKIGNGKCSRSILPARAPSTALPMPMRGPWLSIMRAHGMLGGSCPYGVGEGGMVDRARDTGVTLRVYAATTGAGGDRKTPRSDRAVRHVPGTLTVVEMS